MPGLAALVPPSTPFKRVSKGTREMLPVRALTRPNVGRATGGSRRLCRGPAEDSVLLVEREAFMGMPLDRRVGRTGTTALLSVEVGTTLLLPPPPVIPVVAVAVVEAVEAVSGEADTARSVR